MDAKKKYRAQVHLRQNNEDIVLYFSNITLSEAKTLHRILEENYSHITSSGELLRFGWEEQE